jgi:dephospho-CoA kinase
MIIGLTGPNAAGKGEVAAYLVSRGFAYHSLSDVLREELDRRGILPTRQNLIALGNDLRASGGAGVLAEMIRERLGQRDVVDSIRNPSEVETLRKLPGFTLLGVDAPMEVRFARARRRGRPGDGVLLEEFQAKEAEENSADPARQQLVLTLSMADAKVSNVATLADLHRSVEEFLQLAEARARA